MQIMSLEKYKEWRKIQIQKWIQRRKHGNEQQFVGENKANYYNTSK
jgi:hypothetical protein